MRELSFFLLKNSFGAKIRKGFRNFCNNDGSTSTLNQQSFIATHHPAMVADKSFDVAAMQSHLECGKDSRQPTLEEMLFTVDMEEKLARLAKLDEKPNEFIKHRMSCVNHSDILRTAESALNQYPRFSLDGKDAMYKSSFRNGDITYFGVERSLYLPSKIGGERVTWCKPGVVAKLMGLDALPVPLCRSQPNKERMNGSDMMIRRQNLRRRAKMEGLERRDARLMNTSSCPKTKKGYCVMKPLTKEIMVCNDEDEVGWPIRGGFLYNNRNLV